MRGVLGFLRGLAVDHFMTKLLALILAVIVFVFTRETLTGSRVVESLEIRFEMPDDLAANFVLHETRFVFTDIRIQGLRSIVNEKADALIRQSVIKLPFTREFHRRFGGGEFIELDLEFFRTARKSLLGENVEVVDLKGDDQVLRVERRTLLALELRVANPDQARLSEANPWRSSARTLELDVQFAPDVIHVFAPESAFPDRRLTTGLRLPLFVEIPDLDAKTAAYKPEEQRSTLTDVILGIDFEASGIAFAFRDLIRINTPRQGMSWDELQNSVELTYVVQARPAMVRWDLPMRVLYGNGALELTKDRFRGVGPVAGTAQFDKPNLDTMTCTQLEIELPGPLATDPDLREKFYIELDYTRKELANEDVEVPMVLRTRDEADRKLLDSVRIAREKGQAPRAYFERKQ